MATTKRTRDELIQQDVEDLKRLGYAQQLFREMGGFSNFAISFSIISILTGAVLLFGYGLKFAGPIINSVGWPIVSLFTLCVAASMAELASAYPTAGGLYFWAFRLGGRGWAWLTAWMNMIGQVTITAGINIAAAIYLIGAATRIFDLPAEFQVPVFGKLTNWYFQLFVMVLLMIPQVVLNICGIRLVARLNAISVWWHIGGVLLIAVLLTFWGQHHNPLAFLFSVSDVVNPLEASSAKIDGQLVPALVMVSFPCARPCSRWFRVSSSSITPHHSRWCSSSDSYKRSGLTPVTTPRRTSRKKPSWRARIPRGACSSRSPSLPSSATCCC